MLRLVPVSSDLSLLAVSRTTVPNSQWGRIFHMIWRCLASFLAQWKAVATEEGVRETAAGPCHLPF